MSDIKASLKTINSMILCKSGGKNILILRLGKYSIEPYSNPSNHCAKYAANDFSYAVNPKRPPSAKTQPHGVGY